MFIQIKGSGSNLDDTRCICWISLPANDLANVVGEEDRGHVPKEREAASEGAVNYYPFQHMLKYFLNSSYQCIACPATSLSFYLLNLCGNRLGS